MQQNWSFIIKTLMMPFSEIHRKAAYREREREREIPNSFICVVVFKFRFFAQTKKKIEKVPCDFNFKLATHTFRVIKLFVSQYFVAAVLT